MRRDRSWWPTRWSRRLKPCWCLVPLLAPILALTLANSAVAAESAGFVLTDDLGREVRLAAPARRVVSLYGGFDEVLQALGKGEVLAARTRDAAGPEGDGLPVVGTHLRPNFELIASLAPDLVLQMGGREDVAQAVDALAGLGIPVAVFTVRNFEDLLRAVEGIGRLVGAPDKAVAMSGEMRDRLAALAPKADGARPRVYFEVRESPPIAAGRGAFASDVIRLAGGVNAMDSPDKFVRLGEEAILAADPDVVLVQRGPMNLNPTLPKDRPRLAGLRAVAQGKVWIVDERTYSRPGPRSVDAVADLAAKLGESR